MNPKTKLKKDIGTNHVDPKTYQSLVSGLLHAKISQWNIQFAIECISRYLTNPQEGHMILAKNILWYLKGTFLLQTQFLNTHDVGWKSRLANTKATTLWGFFY